MMRWRSFLMRGIIACLIVCFSWLGHASAVSLDGSWRYREGMSPATDTGVPVWLHTVGKNDPNWKTFDFPQPPALSGETPFVWLTTVVPDAKLRSPMLFFNTTEESFRIYLDDEMVYRYGNLTYKRFSYGSVWHLVPLPAWCGGHRLTFEMYSSHPQRLGKFDRMVLDESASQIRLLLGYDIPCIAALPIAILLCILVAVYSLRRKIQDSLYAFVELFLFLFSVWLFATSSMKEFLWNQPAFWRTLALMMAYALPIAANLILHSVLEKEARRWIRWIILGYIVLFAAVVLGEAAGFGSLDGCLSALYIMLAVLQIPAFWLLWRSAQRGNAYSRSLLMAASGLPILGVYDGITGHFHILSWTTNLLPLGVVTFVFFILHLVNSDAERERHLMKQTATLALQVAVAEEKSEIDPLTKCFNRGKLNSALEKEQAILRETQADLSLIMFDIDFFKQVNDTFGHAAGDQVLINLTAAVRQILDARHTFIRYGGEEFVILCRGFSAAAARELAEQIRQRVAVTEILPERAITISLGVSCWHGGNDSGMALLQRADKALYAAKNAGRNCVQLET